MHRKLIFAALALGLFVQAEGSSFAGTVLSDTLFFNGSAFPVPEDSSVPQSVVIPNFGNPTFFLAVQLYQDTSLTVLSDQLYTRESPTGSDLVFESDPSLTTLSPAAFASILKIAETGGVQDFSSFFGFSVAVQSDVEVPEPATLTLLGIGALGMAGYGWRKRKMAA
jgi:PEP-CTERM motif